MAISSIQQLSDQATNVYNDLLKIQQFIDNIYPYAQICDIDRREKGGELDKIQSSLTTLNQLVQTKRETIFWSKRLEEREALLPVITRLTSCSDILEKIKQNRNTAEKICILQEQFNKILGAPPLNIKDKTALTNRLSEMLTTPRLNIGNQSALKKMLTTLNSEDREIKTQDATDPISLMNDLENIEKAFTFDPTENFHAVFLFYQAAKERYLQDTSNSAVGKVLERAEEIMLHTINAQKQIEAQKKISLLKPLRDLKTEIEKILEQLNNKNHNLTPFTISINETFETLKIEQPALKDKLLETTYQTLKKNNQFPVDKPIPPAMKGISLIYWQGTYQDKLNALNSVIKEIETPITTSISSAPASEIMATLLDEVTNLVRAPLSAHKSLIPQQELSAVSLGRSNEKTTCDFDVTVSKVIQSLQKILFLLSTDSIENLSKALYELVTLESKNIHKSFTISPGKKLNIADRPYFHLYFMCKNENPKSLVQDHNYGNKAMAGIYPTSNVERSRAFQRTILELLLEGLKDAVNSAQPANEIQDLLQLLETMQLDSKDMPENSKNLAHTLFEMMYEKHCKKRETHPSLIHPNDPRFKGDFGRIAFPMTTPEIDPTTKIEAIDFLLCTALKNRWKINN
jgi:hypothetical protein